MQYSTAPSGGGSNTGSFTVGYGQRLRVQRTADVRVLKSQLDLIAEVAHSARFASPVWALCVAFLTSDVVRQLGNHDLFLTIMLPVLIGSLSLTGSKLADVYRRDTFSHTDANRLQPWFTKFIGFQIAMSAAWGLMPWLLWQPGNSLNHVFIAGCTISIATA